MMIVFLMLALAAATVLQTPSDPVEFLLGDLQLVPPGMVVTLQTTSIALLKLAYVIPIDGSLVPWWCNATGSSWVGMDAVQSWVLYTNIVQGCAFQVKFVTPNFSWGLNVTIPSWTATANALVFE